MYAPPKAAVLMSVVLSLVPVTVGTLLEVGAGKIPPEQVKEILEAKNRVLAGPTAPPQGLCLQKVDY